LKALKWLAALFKSFNKLPNTLVQFVCDSVTYFALSKTKFNPLQQVSNSIVNGFIDYVNGKEENKNMTQARCKVSSNGIMIPSFLKSEKLDPATDLKNRLKWARFEKPSSYAIAFMVEPE